MYFWSFIVLGSDHRGGILENFCHENIDIPNLQVVSKKQWKQTNVPYNVKFWLQWPLTYQIVKTIEWPKLIVLLSCKQRED